MANKITLTLGYAANESIPVTLFQNSLSLANHVGYKTAAFNSSGVAEIDVTDLSVSAGNTILAVGSTFNTTADSGDRAISANADVVDDGQSGGGGGSGGTFAPLTANYSSASFTNVTVPSSGSIKASVTGLTTADTYYILGGTASLYVRATDGRVRLTDNDAKGIQFNGITTLVDGSAHTIELRPNTGNTGVELLVDGSVVGTNVALGAKSDCTFNCVGAQTVGGDTMLQGAVYNVELGTTDAWAILGANDEFNTANAVNSGNVLTFNDAPNPITSAHTVDTGA